MNLAERWLGPHACLEYGLEGSGLSDAAQNKLIRFADRNFRRHSMEAQISPRAGDLAPFSPRGGLFSSIWVNDGHGMAGHGRPWPCSHGQPWPSLTEMELNETK